ncbi:hypothetical protein ACP275_06G044500 [Erythranthe tilingii]
MSAWSAENATNAYLRSIKMGKRVKEPDTSEFISALVAGTNACLTVLVCAGAADSTAALALVVAAHQTGGEVICILRGVHELRSSKEALGECGVDIIKFVIGDAEILLGSEYYREADCVVVDCTIDNFEGIFATAKGVGKKSMVLGYNAFCIMGNSRFDGHLLPIGQGLLVSRVDESDGKNRDFSGSGKKSRWVVKVDKFTGEEHFFRVKNSRGKGV